ncbi:MAG: hypothetical protein ACFBSF_01670 [Leptolyngbyaceae cyanobacterium]
MDAQWRDDALKDFTRPWNERRGLESIESHIGAILVKASIDELADILAEIAVESRYDVIGSEIKGSPCFALTYQIVGQSWSIFLPDVIENFPRLKRHYSWPGAIEISRLLKRPAIGLQVSDTGGCISYRLFEEGEITEYFSGIDGGSPGEENEFGLNVREHEWIPYPDDPEGIQVAYFWSRDRQVSIDSLGSIWDIVERFLCDQDAYDPALSAGSFFSSLCRKAASSIRRARIHHHCQNHRNTHRDTQ